MEIQTDEQKEVKHTRPNMQLQNYEQGSNCLIIINDLILTWISSEKLPVFISDCRSDRGIKMFRIFGETFVTFIGLMACNISFL